MSNNINTEINFMESPTMSTVGKEIVHILKDTGKISEVLDYFNENPNIFNPWSAIERDQHLYQFRIPVQYWNLMTGFSEPDYDFRLTTDDGCIFYDCYFDADYRDPTEPDRYIYIATL
jgi:hypothetical protein